MILPSFITKLIFRNDSTSFHRIGGHGDDVRGLAGGQRPALLVEVQEFGGVAGHALENFWGSHSGFAPDGEMINRGQTGR